MYQLKFTMIIINIHCGTRFVKIIKEKLKFQKKWKRFCQYSDHATFGILRDRQKRIAEEC